MKKNILIKNATVWTGGRNGKLLKGYSVLVEGGKIKKVAPEKEFKGKFAKTIDASGKILLPGLINTHMHFYSTFARGLIKARPSKNFMEVLENLWWKLDKSLTREGSYYSALIALINAIKKGTTTIIDHHASPSYITNSLLEIEKAVRKAGLRGALCYEVSDRDGLEKAEEGLRENAEFIKYTIKKGDNTIKALFGLHAQFTLSDRTLEKAAAMGRNLNSGFHIHCAESNTDQINCETHRRMRVVERLNKFGILGKKTILAHCVHINDMEMELIKDSESAVAHNPQSNANNAVGVADITGMTRKGILVGLGTDAMTVNMLEELRSALWLQHIRHNPSVGFMESAQTLMANNAIIVGRYFDKVGEIREGWAADMVLISYHPPTPMETNNFYGHLIFGISQSEVDTTIADGRILMEGKKLKIDIDEEEISKKSAELAAKVWKEF